MKSSDDRATPWIWEYNPDVGLVLRLKLDMAEPGVPEGTFEITPGKQADCQRQARSIIKNQVVELFDYPVTSNVNKVPVFTMIDQLPYVKGREVFARTSNRGAGTVIPHHVIQTLDLTIGLAIKHQP